MQRRKPKQQKHHQENRNSPPPVWVIVLFVRVWVIVLPVFVRVMGLHWVRVRVRVRERFLPPRSLDLVIFNFLNNFELPHLQDNLMSTAHRRLQLTYNYHTSRII
jgi:hypothetical protein